ncbi:Salicylate hydroxylase (Salicylate 1-monooxygenase) [Sporothrix schenckii 1099-18]|uniref:Salicylate hydroxylase (Salicylate 1-monooxygenase) n=1 Tax=Sporothrix schenckii 1099-18 TaxID=1397361 RepID=A0A0F2MKI5_SPOSC|nr:Salicylate hydroxylase (Salicylate 1-monooxygenase) [Sporothrix schenckii 1099-18]KJR89564.1 Salicylate hydroxylase (Salicylate 1-monooxygenase) [Sporothrix schenckii 1099-18]
MPLRIGIVGAGLVGSAAVLALSRLPDAEVVAFEKAPSAREAGAWISLTVTGLKVLTKLIPPAEISAIAYRPPDRAVYVTRHWRTGAVLLRNYSSDHLKDDYVQARTHREPLLKLLLSHVPTGAIQYGQPVVGVELAPNNNDKDDARGPVRLLFANPDGGTTPTSRDFDIVVAADGLYSPIRRQFWPDHRVSFEGAVAYRTIFPAARVAGIAGLHDDSSAWRKDGEVVFLSALGLGMYGVVIIRDETPEYMDRTGLRWEHPIGAAGVERLRGLYADWDPLISRVLAVVDGMDAYPLDSGPWLQQLAQADRIAFVGDAAHPTAGAYGAGAAMGFGDCWALYRALSASRSRSTAADEQPASTDPNTHRYDIAKALRIFEQARLPFLLRVEEQMELDGRDGRYVSAAVADEQEWMRRYVERNPPSNWLTEHDVELEVQNAIMRHLDS